MKTLIILCLVTVLGLTTSCDYSSYRKNKDAEKEKTESMTKESTEGMTKESTEGMAKENTEGGMAQENKSMDTSK